MIKRLSGYLLLAAATMAQAEIVGEVETPDGRIDLHDEKGLCSGHARLAEFVPTSGEAVQGCWVASPAVVAIVFLDGDVARLNPAAIRKPKLI